MDIIYLNKVTRRNDDPKFKLETQKTLQILIMTAITLQHSGVLWFCTLQKEEELNCQESICALDETLAIRE